MKFAFYNFVHACYERKVCSCSNIIHFIVFHEIPMLLWCLRILWQRGCTHGWMYMYVSRGAWGMYAWSTWDTYPRCTTGYMGYVPRLHVARTWSTWAHTPGVHTPNVPRSTWGTFPGYITMDTVDVFNLAGGKFGNFSIKTKNNFAVDLAAPP